MKKIIALLLAAMMLLTVAPVAMAEDNMTVAENNEWWGADVTQLDGTSGFQSLMGDPLCTLDGEGNLQPNICSAVSVSEDGLVITATIPEGMYFYNGEQLEPEDVVASILRIKEVSPMNAQYQSIASVEENGRDVVITLDHYSVDINAALAASFFTIMDKDELESKTNEELYWDCHPYGQYYMKEYVSGAQVVLARNEGYVTYNPFVENKGAGVHETITVRFIGEEFTSAQEFNAGNVAYVTGLSNDGVAQITVADAQKELVMYTPNVNYIELKLDDDLMGDYVIRQAIGLAINREELCELYDNIILPAYSFATEKVRNHNADWAAEYKANWCNDVEKANQLLDDAGYLDTDGDGIREKDGMPIMIKFVYGQTPQDNAVTQGLQVQILENIGLYLDLDGQEDNYHYESLDKGEFQIGMSRFGTADCVQLMQWVLCYFPSFDYLKDWDVEDEAAWMAMCDAVAREPDSAKRTEMIGELDRIVCSSYLVIPVFTNRYNIVYQNGVTPAKYMGNGQVYFNDLH